MTSAPSSDSFIAMPRPIPWIEKLESMRKKLFTFVVVVVVIVLFYVHGNVYRGRKTTQQQQPCRDGQLT